MSSSNNNAQNATNHPTDCRCCSRFEARLTEFFSQFKYQLLAEFKEQIMGLKTEIVDITAAIKHDIATASERMDTKIQEFTCSIIAENQLVGVEVHRVHDNVTIALDRLGLPTSTNVGTETNTALAQATTGPTRSSCTRPSAAPYNRSVRGRSSGAAETSLPVCSEPAIITLNPTPPPEPNPWHIPAWYNSGCKRRQPRREGAFYGVPDWTAMIDVRGEQPAMPERISVPASSRDRASALAVEADAPYTLGQRHTSASAPVPTTNQSLGSAERKGVDKNDAAMKKEASYAPGDSDETKGSPRKRSREPENDSEGVSFQQASSVEQIISPALTRNPMHISSLVNPIRSRCPSPSSLAASEHDDGISAIILDEDEVIDLVKGEDNTDETVTPSNDTAGGASPSKRRKLSMESEGSKDEQGSSGSRSSSPSSQCSSGSRRSTRMKSSRLGATDKTVGRKSAGMDPPAQANWQSKVFEEK